MAISEQELGTMLALITRADDGSQLQKLGNALTARREQLARANMNTLASGQRVSYYNTKQARAVTGTVRKVKQKYVEVVSDHDGMVWNVPGGQLTKVTAP